MIVLSNCLTGTPDEGALKVANSLILRLKQAYPDVKLVTYGRNSPLSDRHFTLNKLFLNPKFLYYLRSSGEDVLYIPFPTRLLPMALRIWILSLFVKRLRVLSIMQPSANKLGGMLIRASKAEITTLSRDTWQFYQSISGQRTEYIQTGVDTTQFFPVSEAEKIRLRKKYGFAPDAKIVLHVGHLNEGRNIRKLMDISPEYQVILVVSTYTANERNAELRKELESHPNIRVLDQYIEKIQEIYQLSNVYFFPVEQSGHCIDIPLSVLEAAACNIPVVATPYGELEQLVGQPGFWFTDHFETGVVNTLIREAIGAQVDIRQSVIHYDWNFAVVKLHR